MKRIKLNFKVRRPILACGADLKGAFALAKGDAAYLYDGFGDLSDLGNFTRYEKAVKSAVKKLDIKPAIVACDLHPNYFSTQFAEDFCTRYLNKNIAKLCTWYKVQHHEAHIASAIVDNGIKGEVFGVAFDGTGYGADGNIWGGEFFAGNLKRFKRTGHLDYIPMPGGDMAIEEPWRMAASYLYAAYGRDPKCFNRKRWAVLKQMIDKKINSPLTSSMGRLFDAVASLVLKKNEALFEAELPIELEKTADKSVRNSYGCDKAVCIIKEVVKDLKKDTPGSAISAKFHNTIAEMILKAAGRAKMKAVVLSGGVFQNKFLLNRAIVLLNRGGFKVFAHSDIQTNDTGIPIGQIAIAEARI